MTLSGYYGYGNAGDEAVLAGLIKGFRAAWPAADLEIIALSGQPAETQLAHGVTAANRYKAGPLISAITRSDLFLSGGGSLLQDVTSEHGIFYYLGVVRLAQLLGKKTMFVAQGIGPLRLARSRRLVSSVANKLDAITVRDSDSARLLNEIGVTQPPLEVTADPALLLEPVERGPQAPGFEGKNFGVALRPWVGQDDLVNQVADACWKPLAESRALLFPMHTQSDLACAEQFAEKWHPVNKAVVCQTQSGLSGLLFNIGSCRMMVGMRLHALILAAACGVPSVALSYDPKVAAFMASCGQGDAVYNLTQPDPSQLAEMVSCVWAERTVRSDALRVALPDLHLRAMRNVEVALNLIAT